MAVMTPFFDIVAGVAILAGRSSLLDAKVFQAANTNITLRQLLALGFIGYGGWNLWKVEKAQEKLKESLESEEGWEDYPTITYQVFGIDDLADAENMSYWYEGGDYSEDDLDSAIQEAQTWWDERDDLDEDDGGGIVRVWVEEKSEHYGVGDNEGSVFTLEAESFAAMKKSDYEKRSAMKKQYREEFKRWVKKPYPYEVRVTQDTKGDWCESCGDISARPEGEGVHYQFVLPRQDSWRYRHRQVEGEYCRGCGSDLCQICVEAHDNYCDSCGELICDNCQRSHRNPDGSCAELEYGAESFNAAYFQDPASEYGGPTEMILDICPVCAEFFDDATPKELWPRWGEDDDMGYMCDDCWDAMESDPYAQWIYTQEAESFSAEKKRKKWTHRKWFINQKEGDEYYYEDDAVKYLAKRYGRWDLDIKPRYKNQDLQQMWNDLGLTGYQKVSVVIDAAIAQDKLQYLRIRDPEGQGTETRPRVIKKIIQEWGAESFSAEKDMCIMCKMKPIDYRNQQSQLDICPSDKCLRRWNNQWNAESFSADFAGMKYELLVDETGNGLEEAEIVATYPTFEEAKNASQKLHSQTWIAETRFVGETDEVIESTIIYGAESFSAESRDELIDTLIGIRQELAREEGMKDWENESEGPLDSLSSAFIQELIWYVDGDRDTWNAESFNAADTFAPAELVFGEDAVVVDDDTGYRCPFEVEEFSDEGLFTYTICNHPLELVYHVADGITSDEPFYTYECSECHEGFQAVYTVCTRNGEKISEDWEVGENLYGWAAEEESYNAEHDSYPMNVMIDECGCGEHEITDDDYDTCETCGTIWEFPDCTSGVCGICFKVCEKCNPKKRKKHYQTCTLEG